MQPELMMKLLCAGSLDHDTGAGESQRADDVIRPALHIDMTGLRTALLQIFTDLLPGITPDFIVSHNQFASREFRHPTFTASTCEKRL